MSLMLPLGLYLLAVIVRLAAASQLPFPTAEPAAWYFGVAENLLAGRGLVSDAIWSYATPPLEVPKPAFELWLPMSTFVSAAAMAVLGSTFWAAQVGGALLGALVAPLAWAIGREAARVHGLDERRCRSVALASGLLTAVLSPLVVGSVIPESFMPFTVFSLMAALLVPKALGVRDDERTTVSPSSGWGLALGLAMGLAYLSRQEIIWLGLTVVLMLGGVARARPTGERARYLVGRLWPIVLGGLLVVGPWLVRNAFDLGSAFPGQAVENMFLTRNEDIFAFLDRPNAARYLDQGIATVLGNPVRAAWDGLFNVITVTAFPVGILGLLSVIALHRSRAIRRVTALSVLLLSGGLTFASTMLLFPVASLWGTFMHASGPLLVGLTIMAGLGGDALLARISVLRRWEKPNVILAPVALIAVAGLLAVFQLRILAEQSRDTESRYATVAAAVRAHAQDSGRPMPDTVITDHPMWVADALGGSAIALPDEDPAAVIELARRFDAPWVVLMDERGAYPEALLAEGGQGCLAAEPVPLSRQESPAWLFELAERCSEP